MLKTGSTRLTVRRAVVGFAVAAATWLPSSALAEPSSPAHRSTVLIAPSPGKSSPMRRRMALQRTGFTLRSYPASSAVPAARSRSPSREITILCPSSVRLTVGAAAASAGESGSVIE